MGSRIGTALALAVGSIALVGCGSQASPAPTVTVTAPAPSSAASDGGSSPSTDASSASASESAAPAEGEPIVVDSGFWPDDEYWGYLVVVDNPNSFPVEMIVDVEALNADGDVLDTSTMYMTSPASQQVGGTSLFFDVPRKEDIEELAFYVDWTESTRLGAGNLEVADAEMVRGSYGDTAIEGNVTSTLEDRATDVYVTAVVRREGRIVTAESDLLDSIRAEGTSFFSVDFYEDYRDLDFDVYLYLS